MTAVELDPGDSLKFTLRNGKTRVLTLEDTWARVVLTNLKEPKKGFGGGGTIYMFGCRVVADGQPMTMIRYVPVQESFYEPYVINGMRVWFDGVRKVGDFFNETHGECVPSKAARLAVQDATLPICPEELRPWYPNPHNYIDVHDSYNGDDVWLGPYCGADLHGGLDINMPIGTALWAPISFDDQFYFNSLAQGDNNNRWRGVRRWSNGERWVLQAHHMTRLLIPERTSLVQGKHYAEAAGVLTGSHAHSHFVFKVGEDGSEVLLDPWIVFWQIFENNKKRANAIRAAIAPVEPARTGEPVQFRSSGSRAGTTGNVLSYCWTFGDGGCSRDETPTHIFTKPGVFPVTLVVSDGTELASVTQHITVSGPPLSSPTLVLSAPEEVEFVPRPVPAMDVYGMPLRFMPHTLRFVARPSSSARRASKTVELRNGGGGALGKVRFQVEYLEGNGWLQIEHKGTGSSQILIARVDASQLTPKHGVYHATVTVTSAGSLNSPQIFSVQLTTPESALPSDVIVDNQDETCYSSPWFWLGPRFRGPWLWFVPRLGGPWPRGYNNTYLIAAGQRDDAGFVRFQPCLAAGLYEIFFDEQTPFGPTAQVSENMRFAVRVRHRRGIEVIWVEPLKSRKIGTFEFSEGNDGYVQIEAKGAAGLVVADAIHFKRLRKLESVSR